MTDLSALIDKLSPQGRAALARQLAEAGVTLPAGAGPDEPVALIGIGCRYPGGVTSPADFWELLTEGRDAVGPFPAERWEGHVNGLPPEHPPDAPESRNPIRSGGFLDDAAGFDAAFFGISPSEAAGMDPQQRVLLEVSWEALEHAGRSPRGLSGSRTGVYVGIAAPDYFVERLHDPSTRDDLHTVTGAIHSTAVGRLSYLLDLHGPSVAVDTACSSSLVAVHLACQSLRNGESDVALAGGVHVISSVLTSFGLRTGGLADEDGRCKTFDASASGIVRAEGCGIVVLKRLADAERDGDRILAVLRGSAVNQDGRSTSLTAPSVAAQRDVLTEALRRSGTTADQVGLIETHGTGTVLGDPIEVEALSAVYGRGEPGTCALGAVKTNFGHSEEAAGVAGLIKAVLSLNAGAVPPNLHFSELNPNITLEGTRFVVPTRTRDWPVGGAVRHAAVSAFGMGGTNAHLVLSEPPQPTPLPGDRREGLITVPLSAGSPAALRTTARRLAEWLDGPGADAEMADIAHTLGRRSHLEERAACVLDADAAPSALASRLRAFTAGEQTTGLVTGQESPAARKGTVWVFPGQGGQWAGMGSELLEKEPSFASAVDEIDPLIRAESGFSVRELLVGHADPDTDLSRAQPMIFTVQVALARTWQAYGLRPAAVIGHSMGEIAAAVVAGALPLADGVRVICRRSRLAVSDPRGYGAMALVELSADETAERLAAYDDVSVAVLSGPDSTVVSGAEETVERLVAAWEEEGLLARRIKGVTLASHSPRVDGLLPLLRERLGTLSPEAPQLDFYSTAARHPRDPVVFDAEYWAANLRNPVRFADAVAAALADGRRLFVEVSPHPTSEPQIVTIAAGEGVSDAVVVPSLRRDEADHLTFLSHVAALHCHGAPVSPPVPEHGRLLDMPTTAWDHRRFWLNPAGARQRKQTDLHPLLGVHIELPGERREHLWQTQLDAGAIPWLAEHRVGDVPVLPGTAYCEMALAAGAAAFQAAPQEILLEDIDYQAFLALSGPVTVTVALRITGEHQAAVEVTSAGGVEGRTVHASARVVLRPDGRKPGGEPACDVADLRAAHTDRREAEELYRRMRAAGQYHGPAFRGTAGLWLADAGDGGPQGELSVVSRLARPEEAAPHPRLHTHPALLDGWFHGIAAAVLDRPDTYLPAGLRTLRVVDDLDGAALAHARVRPVEGSDDLLADIDLLAEDGRVVVEARGVFLRRAAEADLPVAADGRLYALEWEEAPLPAAEERGSEAAVLVAGAGAPARALCEALTAAGRRCVSADPEDSPTFAARAAEAEDVVLLADSLLPDPEGASCTDGTPTAGAGSTAEAEGRCPDGHRADPDGEALAARAGSAVLAAARATAALVSASPDMEKGRPRLWLVTRAGRALSADEAPALAQAGIRGLARTLALEHPDLRTTLVDLDVREEDQFGRLAAELAAGTDDEVAWRDGRRHVARLRRSAAPDSGDARPTVRDGGGYLVTGGLTGVGLHTAEWLAEHGAGCVVLNARSAPGEEAEAALARMRAGGTDVRVVRGDIAAPGTAERLVKEVADAGVPLCGVVHSAMVLDDCVVTNLDAARMERVWRPKALGAWQLHRATADADLDWWVCYSSIASLIGGAGQANYAAANAFLDTLAEWRRAHGLPALSIAWGGWGEIGQARDLSHEAFPMMPPAEGMAVFEALAGRRTGSVAALRLNPEALVRTMPETASSSLFAPLVAEVRDAADDDWMGPEALRGLEPQRRREAVSARLLARVAQVLGHRPDDLSRSKALTRMGLDSLMAVRIKNAVLADFGVALPVARLLQNVSLADLEDRVLAELTGGAARTGASDAVTQARDRARNRQTSQNRRRRNK
ncbi:type I polyketide synthase [Streptomyces sulphureus]|uniref:type I polyketide synthase n=1 Tax=Streptomyces sulphureus TaxID=47758 RepID=UPI000381339A|nr:type I polyketide synthase [Streptomyces sulphureus]